VWVAGEPASVKDRPGRFTILDTGQLTGIEGAMNNTEVTMHSSLPTNNLIAYSKAIEAASMTLSMVRTVPAPFKPLADQAIRAASSVPANISEGKGRFGRDRINHYRIAYGSAMEIDTFMRLLCSANVVDASQAQKVVDLFDQVRAMTWRLIHPKTT
jgi:four helix bundle protein